MLNQSNAMQRSERGLAYEAFSNVIRAASDKYTSLSQLDKARFEKEVASDPDMRSLQELNASILALRGMTQRELGPNDVHYDQILGNLSVQYTNDEFVGLQVMPQVFTNGSRSGAFWKYSKNDLLDAPDDTMAGTKAEPNEITQGRSQGTYALQSRALKDEIAWATLQNQTAPLNELMDSQASVQYRIEFNREKRIATKAMTAGNYGSSNKITIAAADRWDSAGGGDPAGVVDTLKRALWRGGGNSKLKSVITRPTFDILKRHPQVLDKVKYGGTSVRPAGVSRQALAEFFEVDEVLVASAKKSVAGVESYIWGSSGMWLGYVAQTPGLRTVSFGYSIQDSQARSQTFWIPEEGGDGIYRVRVSLQDEQNIIAADAGGLVITPNA